MDSSEAGYGWASDDPGNPRWTPAPDDTARMVPIPPPWPVTPPPSPYGTVLPGSFPAPGPYPAPQSGPGWGGAPNDATSWLPPIPAATPTPLPVPTPTSAVPPWQAGGQYPRAPFLPRDPDQTVVLSRLERRVQARARRRADDEFRRAGRAELFSDDARYGVLFALTALWYVPVAVVFAVWALLIGGSGENAVPAAARLTDSLPWLGGSAALSLAIVGLLRWARIGWRAITLSIAAVLIGGGVVTIAHTLSS